MQETWVWSLGWEDPLEKEMATHSNVLAWRSPWAEELGGLQSMGPQRVGHDWVTNTFSVQTWNQRVKFQVEDFRVLMFWRPAGPTWVRCRRGPFSFADSGWGWVCGSLTFAWGNSTCSSYPLLPSVTRCSWNLVRSVRQWAPPQAASLVYAAHSEDFQSRNFFLV